MKIMIVGLGSMGKRRLRLCRTIVDELGGSYEFAGVDSRADRQAEVELKFGCKTYSSLDDAIARFAPDAAFVCTSPLSHEIYPVIMFIVVDLPAPLGPKKPRISPFLTLKLMLSSA